MKKLLLVFAIVSALAVGCSKYDDSDLKNRMGSLEERVSALEKLCQQMNSDISSLRTLVTALENNDYITSVVPVMQGGSEVGYTISFTKSAPITIYHGQKGEKGEKGDNGYTPVIGAKQDVDGIWYWTVDGDWLTDGSGTKIKAEGQEGESGKTPQLKIEDEYWYISYNDGASWTKLDKATGESGDSFFKDVDAASSDEYVIFTLADGTEIKLPRLSSLTLTLDKEGVIEIEPNSSVSIGYTITGNTDDVSIEVMATGDIKAKVSRTTSTAGTIIITSGDTIDEEYSRIVVIVTNGEKTVMKSLEFVEPFPDDMELMFPDPIFRDYVLTLFDKDNDGKISRKESLAVTEIWVNTGYPEEKSLEGIQYFTNLTSLMWRGGKLTTLDVSNNTQLELLWCPDNQLTTLDVSKNTQLKDLVCTTNQLTTLDVSNNTQLVRLGCNENNLTTLDLSKNTKLEYLRCDWNPLTTLDLSNTNLGNSTYDYPLYCPSALKTLYLKEGWSIHGITEDNGRNKTYINPNTEIIFIN